MVKRYEDGTADGMIGAVTYPTHSAQWRTNSESDEWYDCREKMTRPEIAEANQSYGWTKVRLKPQV